MQGYSFEFIKSIVRNSFLKNVNGVIHVGAHAGQERELYDFYNLNVIWIEPNDEVFDLLEDNIKNFPKQKAFKALITDKDNEIYDFRITDDRGGASSIYKLDLHHKMFKGINESKIIKIKSKTLSTFIEENQINLEKYNFLNMDTQGSELLVLKGSSHILNRFIYIKSEASDFELYEGNPKINDIKKFLASFNFNCIYLVKVKSLAKVGSIYEVIFRKKKYFFT